MSRQVLSDKLSRKNEFEHEPEVAETAEHDEDVEYIVERIPHV